MPVRLRRLPAAAISVALLLALVGCGDDSSSSSGGKTAARLDALTITGDPGTAPEVTWKSGMTATKIEKKTLVPGSGDALAKDQTALIQLWIGDGFTKEKAYSSYDKDGVTLFNPSDSLPAIVDAVEGAKPGSRTVLTGSADAVFGGDTGSPSIGIGNKDTVVVVVDVLSAVADAPSGAEAPAPDWMPKIVFTDGNPTSFDFTGIPQPAGKFRKATLLAGTGERVRKNQTVAVRYLGQVYGGDKPFDQNYTTSVTSFQIGVGKVIPGWDKQVVGSDVGSRIVIEVPPKLGYGEAGNTGAGIKPTDTLFFVIDILAAG